MSRSVRPRADAEAGGGVVAELGRAQRPGQPRGGGQQHGQRERQQPDRRPGDAVDAAGQPAQHQLDVVLVDAGEDVLDDRLHGRGEADAGQDEPEAAVVAGDERARRARRRAHRRWRRPRPASRSSPARAIADDGGGAGTEADADDVGAGERVAQRGLEDRAADAEGDADQHGQHGPRELALHHDVGGAGDLLAAEDPEEVGDRDGVVAQQHAGGEGADQRDGEARRASAGGGAPARGAHGVRRRSASGVRRRGARWSSGRSSVTVTAPSRCGGSGRGRRARRRRRP